MVAFSLIDFFCWLGQFVDFSHLTKHFWKSQKKTLGQTWRGVEWVRADIGLWPNLFFFLYLEPFPNIWVIFWWDMEKIFIRYKYIMVYGSFLLLFEKVRNLATLVYIDNFYISSYLLEISCYFLEISSYLLFLIVVNNSRFRKTKLFTTVWNSK